MAKRVYSTPVTHPLSSLRRPKMSKNQSCVNTCEHYEERSRHGARAHHREGSDVCKQCAAAAAAAGRISLHGANLRDANLYGANLYDANLYGADLYGADLRSADLYGANLRYEIGRAHV